MATKHHPEELDITQSELEPLFEAGQGQWYNSFTGSIRLNAYINRTRENPHEISMKVVNEILEDLPSSVVVIAKGAISKDNHAFMFIGKNPEILRIEMANAIRQHTYWEATGYKDLAHSYQCRIDTIDAILDVSTEMKPVENA